PGAVACRDAPARRSVTAHRRPSPDHGLLRSSPTPVYGPWRGRSVHFRLLGPLEVTDGNGPVQFGEGRQRSVLVLLLLRRNEAIASERLIDALWGEAPPATAAKVLQNYVGQLRRALDDREGERLQTRGHGYALRIEDGELRRRQLRAARAQRRRGARASASRRR